MSAAALFIITRAESPAAIIAALLFFGLFSNTAFTPISVAWIGDIVACRYPGSMGAAAGFFNGLIMSSAVAAPLVSGFLRDVTGSLAPAILAGALLMAGGSVLIAFTPAPEDFAEKIKTEDSHG